MMTIKEFARLCNCNAQTLRYYDKIDLLKPVKVDPWSGYRYYAQTQAVDYVKIKNLQAADFSIEQIKLLLTKSDQQVYEAFNEKIAEQEQKLVRIKEIQQSYLAEKTNMEKVINKMSGFILGQLSDTEWLREFGMNPEDSRKVAEHVAAYMEEWMSSSLQAEQGISLVVDKEVIRGAENVAQKINSLINDFCDDLPETILIGNETLSETDTFDPTRYELLWEIDNWEYVYEFIDRIPKLEEDREYCFHFQLREDKYTEDISFPMYMLGAMILKKEAAIMMGCNVERSSDGNNRFRLLRRKE